jgi:hypothetical protein
MNNMTLERRRPMTDQEYLELLDYAMDMLVEFEAQVDKFCDGLRARAGAFAS